MVTSIGVPPANDGEAVVAGAPDAFQPTLLAREKTKGDEGIHAVARDVI